MHPIKAVAAVIAAVVLACAAAWGAALDDELRSAAERGDANAQAKLGVMLLAGAGVPQDRVEGLRWIHQAAEQGHRVGQFNLGVAYAEGDGGVAKDEAQALQWFRKSADQDYADAQFAVGLRYATGRGGVPANMTEAAAWYRKAADQGQAKAQYALALLYGTGKGVTEDTAEAVRLLRQSAQAGFVPAQQALKQLGQ